MVVTYDPETRDLRVSRNDGHMTAGDVDALRRAADLIAEWDERDRRAAE